MSRSTCVVSPTMTRRTSLPSERATSRTMRAKPPVRVDERTHAACERFVVELLRQMRRAAVEVFQFGETLAQLTMRFGREAAHFVERGVRARHRAVSRSFRRAFRADVRARGSRRAGCASRAASIARTASASAIRRAIRPNGSAGGRACRRARAACAASFVREGAGTRFGRFVERDVLSREHRGRRASTFEERRFGALRAPVETRDSSASTNAIHVAFERAFAHRLSRASPIRTIRSTPRSNMSIWPASSTTRPSCAATKQSSITCASVTPTCTPTMRAAPFSECAARMHASSVAGSRGARSSASRPSVRICACVARFFAETVRAATAGPDRCSSCEAPVQACRRDASASSRPTVASLQRSDRVRMRRQRAARASRARAEARRVAKRCTPSTASTGNAIGPS